MSSGPASLKGRKSAVTPQFEQEVGVADVGKSTLSSATSRRRPTGRTWPSPWAMRR